MHKLQLGTMDISDGLTILMSAMGSWLSLLLQELNSPNSATYPLQVTHYELAESLKHDADLD